MKILLATLLWLTAPVVLGATASWYGEELRGHLMANGKPFNPNNMTCATWFFPLGAKLEVTAGKKSVVVIVTDRGPAKRLVAQGRVIDLSKAAFGKLADTRKGLVTVNIKRMK
jgi:rare lipoprotein A